jgi:hypothetical protein
MALACYLTSLVRRGFLRFLLARGLAHVVADGRVEPAAVRAGRSTLRTEDSDTPVVAAAIAALPAP